MSYGIYIGRNLTADGLPYLAGYGDEPSSHWLELVPAADQARRHARSRLASRAVRISRDLLGWPRSFASWTAFQGGMVSRDHDYLSLGLLRGPEI